VRAEPFGAIELRIGLLFGEDPDDPPGPAAGRLGRLRRRRLPAPP
jgi:hypothetical protein